jgi:hypothetical protein
VKNFFAQIEQGVVNGIAVVSAHNHWKFGFFA